MHEQRTVLTHRQKAILIKNHGSLTAAMSYINEIESLVPMVAEQSKVNGIFDELTFHKTMEAERRKRGLWSD